MVRSPSRSVMPSCRDWAFLPLATPSTDSTGESRLINAASCYSTATRSG
jgi:hypothetical protein